MSFLMEMLSLSGTVNILTYEVNRPEVNRSIDFYSNVIFFISSKSISFSQRIISFL